MWRRKDEFSLKLPALETRMGMIRAIRNWFERERFYEVETPALQRAPGMEAHLRAFRTELLTPELDRAETYFLHTSPEFAMKKLLVAGCTKIFQICHCYRNAEGSSLHSPEFSMIEWYRAHAGYRDIMEDCVALLRFCAQTLNIKELKYKGREADPFANWEIISVCEAFDKYANIDLESFLDDQSAFAQELRRHGFHTDENDRWDDLFFRVFLEKIEPALGNGQPTILYDYPVSMAALSRPKPEDPRFAERFELYICGMELANAFGELTDPVIQKQRFLEDLKLKEELYGEVWPVDEDFIAALEHGMPDSGGIALGIDRLAMLFAGVDRIDDVMWCSVFLNHGDHRELSESLEEKNIIAKEQRD